MEKKKTKFYIIAYAALGKGLSGGDNIFIELARRWREKYDIIVLCGIQAYHACLRRKLCDTGYYVCASFLPIFRYAERLLRAVCIAHTMPMEEDAIIYSASDFWHDVLPAVLLKKRVSKVKWIAGCYLVAPPPFAKRSPYKGVYRIRGIGYWLMQRVSIPLIQRYADVVFVTSEPERTAFPGKKVVVVRGGVSIDKPEGEPRKVYDACFIGRLHYQKGIMELVDIWEIVVVGIKDAQLVIIGDGPLMDRMWDRVLELGLADNVTRHGFLDGKDKLSVLNSSMIMLHPATYDSGGMACAEGMALGLPAVGWDLETHKTYYPKGMVKVPEGDNRTFAYAILDLLRDKDKYEFYSKEALALVRDEWCWDARAKQILKEVEG